APFYDVYETADGGHVAVGAIEPRFYTALLRGLGIVADESSAQMDRDQWPQMRRRFAEVFCTRTRDEWAELFEGTEACVAPVLSPWEAPHHPHMHARGAFVTRGGKLQPGAVPRFSRTPAAVRDPPPVTDALERWGVGDDAVASLVAAGVLAT
ncbi:MAG: CoA transferase, partial [Solirubrobacteraceae bacterium]